VSSRKNRAKDAPNKSQQRLEDFMDEEDIREAEESQQLKMSEEFAGFGTQHDPMRQSAAIDLFHPTEETVGTKLLRRMGWREGQGIGPKVRRAAETEVDGEDAETHLFAPADVHVAALTRKNDTKGLGYTGELHNQIDPPSQSKKPTRAVLPSTAQSDDDDSRPFAAITKAKALRKKTGFGVGILNDNGSDDDDPYSIGPRISYNKTLGEAKQAKTKTKKPVTAANPMLKHKPTFVSKTLANLKGVLRTCHDGRLPSDGFVLADELDSFSTMSLSDDKYRPPAVPEDWKSSISPQTEVESAADFVSTADAARSSTMNVKSRASLLGEASLPGKSVFDFLSSSARDKLVTASGRTNLPAAGNEAGPNVPPPPSLQDKIPQLETSLAKQALVRGQTGWMPYAEDLSKRERYKHYLEHQAGVLPPQTLPSRAPKMSEDDYLLELQEFARAAQVFKPISGVMASRFTSSTSTPQSSTNEQTDHALEALLSKPRPRPEDPALQAAKMGMFGPLTRAFVNFYPNRLLCKRFGVDMPVHSAPPTHDAGPGTSSMPESTQTPAMQFKSFASAGFQTSEKDDVQPSVPSTAKQEVLPVLRDPERAAHVDENEALEKERPGMDVFKAIFGSDVEDDD
jgi:G patch domain-containing protein 1